MRSLNCILRSSSATSRGVSILLNITAFFLLLLLPATSKAVCFVEAGKAVGVDPELLMAIAYQESRLNPYAINLRTREKVDALLRHAGVYYKRSAVYRKRGGKKKFAYYMYSILFEEPSQFYRLRKVLSSPAVVGYDLGLMQINDSHYPRLRTIGVKEEDLVFKPCLNAIVGAVILRECLAFFRGDLKRGLECYQRGPRARTAKRFPYAERVLKIYRYLKNKKLVRGK